MQRRLKGLSLISIRDITIFSLLFLILDPLRARSQQAKIFLKRLIIGTIVQALLKGLLRLLVRF